jgi:hypothetical protein
MKTETLIAQLADEIRPVRPLDPPERRTWRFLLMLGIGVLAMLGLRFLFATDEQALSLAVYGTLGVGAVASLLAIYGAFLTATPERRARRTWLLVPVLAAWLFPLAPGALRQWSDAGFAFQALTPTSDCVLVTIVLSITPLLLFAVELSRSASRNPAVTGAIAGLAVGAAVWIGLRILIPHPDAMMLDMAVEQFGAAAFLAALGAILGPTVIGRITPGPVTGSTQ